MFLFRNLFLLYRANNKGADQTVLSLSYQDWNLQMLVRIANRVDPDQAASSEAV